MGNESNDVNVDNLSQNMSDVNESDGSTECDSSEPNQLLCWKCGEILGQDQLFCPKCGSKSDAPIERNNSIAEFNENAKKKKKTKKRKLILFISIFLVVFLVGGIVSYFLYFEPNSRYNKAVSLYDAGEYEEASVMFKELNDFKDSSDRIIWCEKAINQRKYDEATKKAENYNYSEAIKLFAELGDFSDSKAQITKIENEYYELLQQIYNYVSDGFELDNMLSSVVYNTLRISDLYDGYDSVAISNLYSGSSYRTYYYWSRYSNGYKYVVEYDTAQAFVGALEVTNENISKIELLLLNAKNPPEKHAAIYEKVNQLCTSYIAFHEFVKEETSLSYSSYEYSSEKKKNAVKDAMSATTEMDDKIDDKVSLND